MHGCLLLGLLGLLRVLFGQMPADHAAAHRPHYRVMSSVMTGDTAHHRAFDTTRRIGVADGGERQRGADEGEPDATCFHV